MPPRSRYKYDKRTKKYVKDGVEYYKYKDRYIEVDSYQEDPDLAGKRYKFVNGEIIVEGEAEGHVQAPQEYESLTNVQRKEYFQGEKYKYFVTDDLSVFIRLPEIQALVDSGKTAALHNELAKFFVIHPDARPVAAVGEEGRAKKAGYVINPITGKEQKVDSKHMKQLMKVYDYDARRRRLVRKLENEIEHVYNTKTGNLILRKSAEKMAKKGSGMMMENVYNNFGRSAGRGPDDVAMNGEARHYNVMLDVPIAISELDSDTVMATIKPYIDSFQRECGGRRCAVEIGLKMVSYNARTGYEFGYVSPFNRVEWFDGAEERFNLMIQEEINMKLNEYQDQPEAIKKVRGIYFKLIAGGDVEEGGCGLRRLFPQEKLFSQTFFWFSSGFEVVGDAVVDNDVGRGKVILKAIDSSDENCLLDLVHYYIRDLDKLDGKDVPRFTKELKSELYVSDRMFLGLEVGVPIPVTLLRAIGERYDLKIEYYASDDLSVLVNQYSYLNGSRGCLKLTVLSGHYFQIIDAEGVGDSGMEYALKYVKDLDVSRFAEASKVVRGGRSGEEKAYRVAQQYLDRVPEVNYRQVAYLKIRLEVEDGDVYDDGKLQDIEYYLLWKGECHVFPDVRGLFSFLGMRGSRITKIVTFGGSKLDLHWIYQAVISGERGQKDGAKRGVGSAKLNKRSTCFFNNTFYRLSFDDFEFFDLGLFLRNQTFEAVMSKVNGLDLDGSGFDYSRADRDIPYYLECLQKGFRHFNSFFYSAYGLNLTQFYSISGIAETVMLMNLDSGMDVRVTHPDVYTRVIAAKSGARTFPLIKSFRTGVLGEGFFDSLNVGSVLDSEDLNKLVDSGDYLRYVDVDSGYPYVMYSRMFPTGRSELKVYDDPWVLSSGVGGDRLSLGLYKIRFSAPSDLRVPVLLKHGEMKTLVHDLLEGTGWYIHEEINLALDVGYSISVLESVLWSGASRVFEKFVSKIYPEKLRSDGDALMRQLNKDILNSCFGKMFQKIGHYDYSIVSDGSEFDSFMRSHRVQGTIFNQSGSLTVFGKSKLSSAGGSESGSVDSSLIRRPYHLGVFILGYFRAYMVDLMRVISQDLKRVPFYYISTDAIVIRQSDYELLEQAGYMFPDNVGNVTRDFEQCLGKLKDNLSDGRAGSRGYIVSGDFYSVNQLRYKYVNDLGEVCDGVKSSGIRKDDQSYSMFDDQSSPFEYMQTRIKHDDSKGLNGSGMVALSKLITGKIERKLWDGMDLDEASGEWYPKGFDRCNPSK